MEDEQFSKAQEQCIREIVKEQLQELQFDTTSGAAIVENRLKQLQEASTTS